MLCFLACLTALGVLAADRAARGWSDQLSGEATVIVRARGGETPDAAAARAAEALAGVPGVESTTAPSTAPSWSPTLRPATCARTGTD